MGGLEWLGRGLRRIAEASRSRADAEMTSAAAGESLSQQTVLASSPAPYAPQVSAEVGETVVHPSVSSRDDADVPRGLRIAAAWSWRLLILAAVAVLVFMAIGRLRTVLIPLSIALLLSALLSPAVGFLRRRVHLPRSLATAVVLIGGLGAVVGTLTMVVTEFVNGFSTLADNAASGVRTIQDWLQKGPAHLSNKQFTSALETAQRWIQDNRGNLTSSAVSTAAATIEFFALVFLVLFATFFFLRDGRKIWSFLLRLLPAAAREPIGGAGEAAWLTLVSYVRATVLVAFIDALGIGIALLVLNVGFEFPLAALVFLAAFMPIVGATVSGSVAVLVALVTGAPWSRSSSCSR